MNARKGREEGSSPKTAPVRLLTAEGWFREIVSAYGKPPPPVQTEKKIEQKLPRG